jgi:ribose 5-phosphate isomerase B
MPSPRRCWTGGRASACWSAAPASAYPIAANRHPGIRCALVHDVTGARLSREHNDANVLALGARTTGPEVALDALRAFLATPFAGGRHERRIRKLTPDWSPRP